MLNGTISYWRKQLTSGAITPTELVQETARSIEAHNPGINAYLSWDTEAALAAATKADLSKPLGGIPIAVKDNIAMLGQPTRCASRMLETFVSPYDATAVVNMTAAGAIPFGRTNMDEFAMGSYGQNSAFGETQNPAAPGHVPGGSSSGSAAAVAGGMAIAALGSDTGGSIRQPASHCGVVGIKPTYGRVSRYGLVAFASSLDQIGPITRNVEDAATLLNAICGHDAKDSTSSTQPVEDFAAGLGKDIKGMRIGLPKEYLSSGNSPAVAAIVGRYADIYTENGDRDVRYAYLTWDDLRELGQHPLVELQAHTYDMHSLENRPGCSMHYGETLEAYTKAFNGDLAQINQRFEKYIGSVPTAFAYPYGIRCPEGRALLQSAGYKAIFTCDERVNTIRRGDPACLLELGRYNRPHSASREAFFARMGIV